MSMPVPLLNAYASLLPRLVAEESLVAAERIAVGSGTLRPHARRQLLTSWERQTDRLAPRIRPRDRASFEAQMAMAGIPVKREPKRDG